MSTPIDWSVNLPTAFLIVALELRIVLPILGWYVLNLIRRELPDMILDLLEDKEFVMKVRSKMSQFLPPGMMGRGVSIEKAMGMGLQMALPMLLQKFFGGFPAAAPPVEVPPPPPP